MLFIMRALLLQQNQTIVTITEVRKSVINELGYQYRQGKISPELDARIIRVDREFIKQAGTLEHLMVAYKNGGATEGDVKSQLTTTKLLVAELIFTSREEFGELALRGSFKLSFYSK